MCIKHPSVCVHMARSSILTTRTHISHIRRRDAGPACEPDFRSDVYWPNKKKDKLFNENISQCWFHVHFLAAGFPVIFLSYEYCCYLFLKNMAVCYHCLCLREVNYVSANLAWREGREDARC